MGMVRPGGRRAASLPGVMVLALGLANLVACGTTAPAESERLMAQAKAALDGGDAAAADRFLATILERDPADIPALVSRAKLHVREGRFVQAAEIYSRLARLRPQNGLYALRAGSFLKTAGKLRDARTFLERIGCLFVERFDR
ncbi:MAG: tetratricopeptide repeat protein, partial [Acidobacteriota bacterium]